MHLESRDVFSELYDPKAGFVGSLFDINLITTLNHHFDVTGGILEEECSSIFTDFFKTIERRNGQKKVHNIEEFELVYIVIIIKCSFSCSQLF